MSVGPASVNSQTPTVLTGLSTPPQVCLPQLGELSFSLIPQPEARAALVWILGQFGQHIQVCEIEV